MRIALLTCAAPWPDRPTIGLYNVAQARALRELGHACEIFTMAPRLPRIAARLGGPFRRQFNRPDSYAVDDVPIHTVRALAAFPRAVRAHAAPMAPALVDQMFSRLTGRPLHAALDAFRPDALVIHGLLPWAGVGRAYARAHDAPLAAIEHSYEDVMRIRPHSALHRHIIDRSSSCARILAVSAPMTDHLRTLGVSNAGTILNGVNLLTDDELAAARARRDDHFTVLCAGAYHERKGHLDLLRSFARAGLDQARLRLVGAPPRAFLAEAGELGVLDQIEILPLMPNRELLAEMARADLFALPSWAEAFGLVFMEALGAETPVLLTKDSGAAGFLRTGVHGWVVPPRDLSAITIALQSAAQRPAACRRMGEAGRALVASRFTWRRNAEALLDAFTAPTAASAGPTVTPAGVRLQPLVNRPGRRVRMAPSLQRN